MHHIQLLRVLYRHYFELKYRLFNNKLVMTLDSTFTTTSVAINIIIFSITRAFIVLIQMVYDIFIARQTVVWQFSILRRFEKVGNEVGSSFYFFAVKITYPFANYYDISNVHCWRRIKHKTKTVWRSRTFEIERKLNIFTSFIGDHIR